MLFVLGKKLANTGIRVLLLEGGPNKGFSMPLQFSNRVVALNPSSIQLLKGFLLLYYFGTL